MHLLPNNNGPLNAAVISIVNAAINSDAQDLGILRMSNDVVTEATESDQCRWIGKYYITTTVYPIYAFRCTVQDTFILDVIVSRCPVAACNSLVLILTICRMRSGHNVRKYIKIAETILIRVAVIHRMRPV